MRGDGDDGVCVRGEDVVEDELGAVVLGRRSFGSDAVPKLVGFGQKRVDIVIRE